MAVTNNTYKKLDELKATAFVALKKDEALKQAAQQAAQKEKLEKAELLLEQQEILNDQQKHLIEANIHSDKSTAAQSVEPSKKEQKHPLPIVSKQAVSQQKGFSEEFIKFSKKAHEEAAQQVQTLGAAVAEIFANDPEAAEVMQAHGGQEAFVADAVENFRQRPLYHEATQQQRDDARQIYNTFMNGAAANLQGQQPNNAIVGEEHNERSLHEYHGGHTISVITQVAINRNLQLKREALEILRNALSQHLPSQKPLYNSNWAIILPTPRNQRSSDQEQSLNIAYRPNK